MLSSCLALGGFAGVRTCVRVRVRVCVRVRVRVWCLCGVCVVRMCEYVSHSCPAISRRRRRSLNLPHATPSHLSFSPIYAPLTHLSMLICRALKLTLLPWSSMTLLNPSLSPADRSASLKQTSTATATLGMTALKLAITHWSHT